MKKGSNISEFGKILTSNTQKLQEVQTHWATVKSVDWEAKTMTVTGVVDDLDFFNVLLGLGSINRKPTIGKKCLIGIVNNNSTSAFLIECESVDEIEINDKTGFKLSLNNGQMTINGDQFGGIVNAIELKAQLDKNTLILQKMQTAFANWITVPNDGGAALKVLSVDFISLDKADLGNIQNEAIKHG